MHNETLLEFEQQTGLGPTYAARLLGTAYSTYAQYRSGMRELPKYHRLHVQAVLLLPRCKIEKLIMEHVIDGRPEAR